MKDLETKLKLIYGSDVCLSKIYQCKDGRKRVDIIQGETRRTVQLARVVLEALLGRKLSRYETVDHIDGDKTNDEPENLRAISLAENAADSARRLKAQGFVCPECGVEFTLSGRKLGRAVRYRAQGKYGPFCTKTCAGKYGAEVQNGRRIRGTVLEIKREYFTNKGV